MNKHPKYLGHTVQGLMHELEISGLGPGDMLLKLEDILQRVRFDLSLVEQKMISALKNMGKTDGIDIRELVNKEISMLRINLLVDKVPELLEIAVYPDAYTHLRELWDKVIKLFNLGADQGKLDESLRSLNDEIVFIRSQQIAWSEEDLVTSIHHILTTLPDLGYLLYRSSQSICIGKPNKDRSLILQLYEQRADLVQYIKVLSCELQHLKQKVDLLGLESHAVKSMKINWIGSMTDCSSLIRFLMENGYIEKTKQVNMFIAKHFLFNGEEKSSSNIKGLHIDRSGRILDLGSSLKIPSK
jgi:hypothetical protein